MLLMHSHNITDVKEQFLIEMTHIPLALARRYFGLGAVA